MSGAAKAYAEFRAWSAAQGGEQLASERQFRHTNGPAERLFRRVGGRIGRRCDLGFQFLRAVVDRALQIIPVRDLKQQVGQEPRGLAVADGQGVGGGQRVERPMHDAFREWLQEIEASGESDAPSSPEARP